MAHKNTITIDTNMSLAELSPRTTLGMHLEKVVDHAMQPCEFVRDLPPSPGPNLDLDSNHTRQAKPCPLGATTTIAGGGRPSGTRMRWPVAQDRPTLIRGR